MAKKHLYILLFLALFFLGPMVLQAQVGLDVSPIGLLLKLPVFLVLGFLSLWFIQKKTDLQFLDSLWPSKSNWLLVISQSFMLLAVLYLLKSLGDVTYARWLPSTSTEPELITSLEYILSRPALALILIGPFVWLNVLFIEGSRACFHRYLSAVSTSKWTAVLSIIIVPLILSVLQIDDSPVRFISLFITNLALSVGLLVLKDLKPLIIASILFQSIDLIALWVYR